MHSSTPCSFCQAPHWAYPTSICFIYHHLNIIVIIFLGQVQPGDHIAPYIAFILLCVLWPMTCQNLNPSPESNGWWTLLTWIVKKMDSSAEELEIAWWPCVDNNCGRLWLWWMFVEGAYRFALFYSANYVMDTSYRHITQTHAWLYEQIILKCSITLLSYRLMHRGVRNFLDVMPFSIMGWTRTKQTILSMSVVHHLTSKSKTTKRTLILHAIWETSEPTIHWPRLQ